MATDFNQAAAEWDVNQERRRRSEEIARLVGERLALDKSLKLLEFGSGTGVISLLLARSVGEVVAADTAEEMLKVARDKAASMAVTNFSTVHLKGKRSEALPECDRIVSSMTLHHVEDVAELMRRFHRALRPGGMVALADLDFEGGLFHPDPEGVYHQGFLRMEIRQMLDEAGFRNIVVDDATTMRKVGSDGIEREFPVFLAIAQR